MIKLLFRWKGSVYRLVLDECVLFLMLFSILSLIYRYALEPDGKQYFEYLVLHFGKFAQALPLSWVLGFYVGIVVNRWINQFNTIPWPDEMAIRLNAVATLRKDVHTRMIRRTIIRYVNLGITIALLRMLDPVQNPYKTLEDLVEEGLLMDDEKKLFDEYRKKRTKKAIDVKPKKKYIFERSEEDCRPRSFEEFWIPLTWSISLLNEARAESLIGDLENKGMIEEIMNINTMCTKLICYDWINVPLVYTQVVTIAVYSYFIANLLGSQFIEPEKYPDHNIDYFLPIFTILQFVFYIGWLKVAVTLLNPFGGDDDDFEIVYLIKRNKEAGYAIADELVAQAPKLKKDTNWEETVTEPNITNIDVRRSIRRKESINLHYYRANMIKEMGNKIDKEREKNKQKEDESLISQNKSEGGESNINPKNNDKPEAEEIDIV